MTTCRTCRTIAEVEAQADRDSLGDPPLSQEAADRIAAILAAEQGMSERAAHAAVTVLSRLSSPAP